MVSALIPARYRSLTVLLSVLTLIGLFTHLHTTYQPFRQHVHSLFPQRIRNGEQAWYYGWEWRSGAQGEDLVRGMERVASGVGTTMDVVRASRERILGLQDECRRDGDRWEREYGRANLRMARSYEGSHARLKQVIRKALRGQELVLSTIGGSGAFPGFGPRSFSFCGPFRAADTYDTLPMLPVTNGHGVSTDEIWFSRFGEWFEGFMQPRSKERIGYVKVNGAVPATGSDYFSFCSSLHIPHNSSLIVVELSINDEYLPAEHTANMENLLRGLLELPHRPAVVLVQALEFHSAMMANGGDVHLPVALYYDVPVISMRNPLAGHMMRHTELLHPYFTTDWWQNPDVRHVNARGHRDMANVLASLVQDVACEYVGSPEATDGAADDGERDTAMLELLQDVFELQDDAATLPVSEMKDVSTLSRYWQHEAEQARPWGPWHRPKEDDEPARVQHGVWSEQRELGQVPRLRFLQHWSEHTENLPLEPQCFSTRSQEHPLTPVESNGWRTWYHPDRPEKTYLFSNTTGSAFKFDIETRLGIIKMYSLRSKTFGLGSVWCWVDGKREQGVRADGYWDNGNANIGRFTTIADNLQPGLHSVECELLEDTKDPGGGHEFRIISLMSL
ncbi:hypothetical protein NliqN6_1453 [Naganishia liquefaciens]|uniref:Capsular associated protein n=1 Tax=Naganishia liquefaciens TaxID=104408 RepID=A0A8H3TPN2_9TREE|nr:hypothetical protein NliqN6_1453 [Naganishia liquefaciens]